MLPGLEEKQDRAFAAHILDLVALARDKHCTRFTGFLDLHQQAIARQALASERWDRYLLFGGHPDGERVMLGVFASYDEPSEYLFPIEPVTVTFREQDTIGHRDLLGSLLGLELRREAVGDILVESGRAVLFLTDKVTPVVLGELEKVGRHGVKTTAGIVGELPALHAYQDKSVNIPSLRLDCMAAALTNLSREKAVLLIRAGHVSVNGAPKAESAHNLTEGDVLSIRGHGKFLFAEISHTTKKGRLQVLCKKYV